jgi:hypothetical protein
VTPGAGTRGLWGSVARRFGGSSHGLGELNKFRRLGRRQGADQSQLGALFLDIGAISAELQFMRTELAKNAALIRKATRENNKVWLKALRD